MIKYRVGLHRENGITCVGIERLNEAHEVEWIGSYHCGNWSRRDVCVFYVRLIRSHLEEGETASIKVADRSIVGKKSWYLHYRNIKVLARSGPSTCKTATELAYDAFKRGETNNIVEEWL